MALSPLLSRPAAVAGSGVDEGVAAHYGELSAEQRRLLAGTAVADMSHFDVVTLAGEDRLSWLNTLSSQMLLELRPGQSTQTLLLTVQGRVEFDIRILADEDKLWLLVEPGQGAPLAAWLDRMRFMLRVEVKDVSDGLRPGRCLHAAARAGGVPLLGRFLARHLPGRLRLLGGGAPGRRASVA